MDTVLYGEGCVVGPGSEGLGVLVFFPRPVVEVFDTITQVVSVVCTSTVPLNR